MVIKLSKFGEVLVSRPSGKEAFLAFAQTLNLVRENERVEVDFTGVAVLTPSWADEFLTPLVKRFPKRVFFGKTTNPSVLESLKILSLNDISPTKPAQADK